MQLQDQYPPKLSEKQMEERCNMGVMAGGIVGLALMGIILCCIPPLAFTPFSILLAIGISFVALIACLVAGNMVAKNWDAILGFFGKQPKAPS
ncbi:MAG: hypothetical protein LBF26_03495 [Puniceicoccales bacterium]|nr:hypothetical protein [Puniceicoccales bacterium]